MKNSDFSTETHSMNYVMRLFISDNAVNSRIARENLSNFLAEFPQYSFQIEVVDLYLQPEMALQNGIFITPTLQILAPQPGGIIYGNLSDRNALERILQIG